MGALKLPSSLPPPTLTFLLCNEKLFPTVPQIPYLSLLYLQHWKRWNFVSGFIFAGGLHALCGLFMHSNLVVRMKAVNTFATITSHSAFDWFCSPRSSTEARLHQALLALRTDPGFLSGLIANSWGSVPAVMGYEEDTASTANGKTFPGGALMCLEVGHGR